MAKVEVVEVEDTASRDQAFLIRRRVFIDEQEVPAALEFDRHDADAVHLLALIDGRPVGTLRIRSPEPGRAKIERVAVVAEERGSGIGRVLLLAALDRARAGGAREVRLHAQVQATTFYERLGFRAEGAPFVEDGIPHVLMVLADGPEDRAA